MIKSQICFLFGEFLLALKILFFSDCTLLIPIRMMFYYVSQYNLVIKCVKEREINFKWLKLIFLIIIVSLTNRIYNNDMN